jgi:hypothetical protein
VMKTGYDYRSNIKTQHGGQRLQQKEEVS